MVSTSVGKELFIQEAKAMSRGTISEGTAWRAVGGDIRQETHWAERHAIMADLPLMYPGASVARKLSVPAMLPAQ